MTASPHLLLSAHLAAQVPQVLAVQPVPASQLRGSRREAGLRARVLAGVQPGLISGRLCLLSARGKFSDVKRMGVRTAEALLKPIQIM